MSINVHDILLVVFAFLGIPAGMLLARLAKEEIKPGKKYFSFICDACLVAIFVTALYFSWTKFLSITFFLVLAAFFKRFALLVYFFLAVIAFVAIKEELSYLISSFIFIFLLAYVAKSRG